jgi:hypothetical protein
MKCLFTVYSWGRYPEGGCANDAMALLVNQIEILIRVLWQQAVLFSLFCFTMITFVGSVLTEEIKYSLQ